MAIRKNTNPTPMQLHPELMDLLARNGMQASVTWNANQPQLVVRGHDSPVLTYSLSEKQMLSLTDWGTNSANKKAYRTFTDIVGNDFDLPKNFVHARNANGRVAMGLHGYRIGVGEYGRQARMTPREAILSGMPLRPRHMPIGRRGIWSVLTPFLGWTSRQQDGYHLRRMGGVLVAPNGAPIVADRPDGRIKPGELQNGGYGFYYKGDRSNLQPNDRKAESQQVDDPLSELKDVLRPMKPVERPKVEAKPYNELITSPVYFSKDKWMECLSLHGLVLDEQKGTLTVQSEQVSYDLTYDLSPEEMKKLTDNSLKSTSVRERMEILNKVIGQDYDQAVTMEMLNSRSRVNIPLKEEVKQEIAGQTIGGATNERGAENERAAVNGRGTVDGRAAANERGAADGRTAVDERGFGNGRAMEQPVRGEGVGYSADSDASLTREMAGGALVADGKIIPIQVEKAGMHWQIDARHGRDVMLENVVAYENAGHFYLRADVNGKEVKKELTAEQFREIHYRNDDRRIELVSGHLDGIRLANGDYRGDRVNTNVTDGERLADLKENHMWVREGRQGREVTVANINVEPMAQGKFKMSAIIDGEVISHEISRKDFNKFMAMDDYHRMKFFNKIFDEVDIKDRVGFGTKLSAALAAAITVMEEVTVGMSPYEGPRVMDGRLPHRAYFKPGVDTPSDVAMRNFEAAMVTDEIHHSLRK